MYRNEVHSAFRLNIRYFIQWTVISVFLGIVCGLVGTAFGHSVAFAKNYFFAHESLLFLMPAAGILIAVIHHMFNQIGNKGTNIVLESISANEKIRFSTFPCIFVSTILTHFVGGSAGKEGAALQIGGCLGSAAGEWLKLDEKDKKVAIMSGMSGCFAAIFGTPLAAAIFGMEVVSVGAMYYSALVPCVFSAFIGAYISRRLGLHPEGYTILSIPEFDWGPMVAVAVLGAAAALVSGAFCILLHETQKLYKSRIKNVYVRILTASAIFIALTLLSGTRLYCSGGFNLIEGAMAGEVRPESFLLKMIFTAVCLGGGFKGGEIVPTLAVGATLGCAYGALTGFSPTLCAACGMLALFVGVTNCPIATLFMGFELFGFEAMPYFAIVVAISFTLSGYYGLYSSQKFTYSKTRTEFINRHSNHHHSHG